MVFCRSLIWKWGRLCIASSVLLFSGCGCASSHSDWQSRCLDCIADENIEDVSVPPTTVDDDPIGLNTHALNLVVTAKIRSAQTNTDRQSCRVAQCHVDQRRGQYMRSLSRYRWHTTREAADPSPSEYMRSERSATC